MPGACFHPGLRRRIPEGSSHIVSRNCRGATGADVIVSGVNSLGVHWVGQTLARCCGPGRDPFGNEGPGGRRRRLRILPDVLASELPSDLRDQVNVYAVAGPVLAYELSGRRISATVFCGRKNDFLRLRGIFHNEYYRVWRSTDSAGVEVFAALKNALIIGIGRRAECWKQRAVPTRSTRDAQHSCPALCGRSSELARSFGLWADGGRVCRVAGRRRSLCDCTGGRTFRLGWLMGRG